VASAHVGARRREWADAKRLGNTTGVASAYDGPRMQAREWACELRIDPALAPSGWKSSAEGGASARRGRTPASSASVEGQRDERVGFYPFLGEREYMCGCTDTRLRAKARACARRGHGHGDGRDHGGDTTTGRPSGKTRKGGQPTVCARGEYGCGTCTIDILAWLDGRITQRDGAAARQWHGISL
jgi:hypothetical protein